MTIHTLNIGLETKSGDDISKTGVYRYAEDPEFDILLFGVSIDKGPAEVYGLARGERIPEEILQALTDDQVVKHACNASFERVCLSYWLRNHYPLYFKSHLLEDDPAGKFLKVIFAARRGGNPYKPVHHRPGRIRRIGKNHRPPG